MLDIDKECMNLREYSVGKTAVNGSGLSLILVPEDRSVIVAHRPWVESAAISYELTYSRMTPVHICYSTDARWRRAKRRASGL